MKRPLLVYDGDCGFCRRWVLRWRRATRDAVDYEPLQSARARFPDEDPSSFEEAVQWFGADGSRAAGAEAVFRALELAPGRGYWLRAYRSLPGFKPAADAAYRLVARRRPLFSRLDRLLWGATAELPSYRASFWLMLRLLGLIHLAAFASLWVQASGLWGPDGILPIAEFLELVRARFGAAAFRLAPSVFWLGSGLRALHAACAAGVALSTLVALGWAVGPALFGLWALYLSFLSVGREFMSFQWDILLLETTFLLMLSAPWRLKPDLSRWKPPAAGLWLARLLLLRLMFESGAVKLLSGDPSWRDLTALRYHYETQPLPTWTSWYAHQLPLWSQKACCALMFAIELGAPWLMLLPRRPRLLSAGLIALLMALIAATGNYNFFNALGALLCLTLVDDAALGKWAARLLPPLKGEPARRRWAAPVFALLAALALLQAATFSNRRGVPRAIRPAVDALSPFALVNGYGLFAVMTKTRPEIIVEGTDDGRVWQTYEFKYKPGDVRRRPRFVAPHQPRLDWQMWFASLSTCRDNQWFVRFQAQLLKGSKPVSALLAKDPFEGRAPKAIRSTVYDYRFSEPGDAFWWRRMPTGPYCPAFSLRQ